MLSFAIGSRTLTVPDERAWAFAAGSYYEHNVDTWIGALLAARPGAVFYDVGSNIGYYALRAAACGARSVFAFEPVSSTFSVLAANAGDGGDIRAVRLGVSSRAGSTRIQLYSSSGSNSLFGRELPPRHPHRHLGEESIELTTLDDFIAAGAPAPDLVKLDVEGGELDALRGAARLLEESRPVLVMEVSEEVRGHAGHSADDVLAILSGHGYELWGLSARGGDLNPHRLPCAGVENVIAVPAGFTLPGPEAVRAAHALRPALTALQRFQAGFAQLHRHPLANAAAGIEFTDPAAAVLRGIAERRGHLDFVASADADPAGAMVAAIRSSVRGVVAVAGERCDGELLSRRFAADLGVRVEQGAEGLAALLAQAPRPPLVWLGATGRDAEPVLRALAQARVPAGTTLALSACGEPGVLKAAIGNSFPDAACSELEGVLIVET